MDSAVPARASGLAVGAAPVEAAPPPARTRAVRTLAVAAFWAAALLPAAAGWQRCTLAVLLHRPCPGCGMTRAMWLLLRGDVAGSLHMHPLAVPAVASWMLLVASTVLATWAEGTPFSFHRTRLGRATLGVLVAVYAAMLVLWGLRWLGLFGGPVPVH